MNAQTQLARRTVTVAPNVKAAAAVFTLPPLPYAENALEPVISTQTVRLHYGKHNKGYVDTLNQLVAGTPFRSPTSESPQTSQSASPASPRAP
jgi:Fe-Mn family superoxide dismutase